TSITAWEALFSRLRINPDTDAGKRILIIGGAGGVGSIAIQLAKQVASLEVVATASRAETRDWCHELGADHTINHFENLQEQLTAKSIIQPEFILCLNDTDQHFASMVEVIAPQGLICSIVGSKQKHDLDSLKSKSAGFVWEFMFTRSMFQTQDMIKQHELLNEISELLDNGRIKTTLNTVLGKINPENIREAHHQLEKGHTIGKMVLSGFESS
ncbi:MAG: zinc-binding alcohol dehydrogenase family protein, partial [Gammaproteobacteria bacterium]